MTCRELTDFILDYVAGELPAALREAFERHLAVCPNCVTYLATYRLTVRAGKEALGREDAGASDLPDALVQAILAARREARS
jgi:anti-sigma factor RsiW